jgi:hypothetical protein
MNFRVGDIWISSKKEIFEVVKLDETRQYYPIMIRDLETRKTFVCDMSGVIVTPDYQDKGQLAIRTKKSLPKPINNETKKVLPC